MGEVLKASNSSFSQIVKSTVFLKDMGDFAAVNEVYGKVNRESCQKKMSELPFTEPLPVNAALIIEMPP
jgi:enamine deaminase RidA (YjgF/YER057c/UK114 family)